LFLTLNACRDGPAAFTFPPALMLSGSSRQASRLRFTRAFTIVEVMVVVVIIGFLAAAGLPSYRHITMRSKVTALENDLRQFSTAIQTFALQNGRWPADGEPQTIPSDLTAALSDNFTHTTPIGGVYKWNYEVPADGVTAKAALVVQTASGNPVSDDEELFLMIDRQMDDGVLETGNIQVGSTNSLVFIIEK
jgi:prepilin-type N-terminal cleavage/methylation domain-containing protein